MATMRVVSSTMMKAIEQQQGQRNVKKKKSNVVNQNENCYVSEKLCLLNVRTKIGFYMDTRMGYKGE